MKLFDSFDVTETYTAIARLFRGGTRHADSRRRPGVGPTLGDVLRVRAQPRASVNF